MSEPRFLALCRPVIFLCSSSIKKTCSGHKSLLLLSALSIHSFVEGQRPYQSGCAGSSCYLVFFSVTSSLPLLWRHGTRGSSWIPGLRSAEELSSHQDELLLAGLQPPLERFFSLSLIVFISG